MRGARMSFLLATHVALVVASVFIMDWVIRGASSADLWAVSQCSAAMCFSHPLEDGNATSAIWQALLFSAVVIWQGGSRAFGREPSSLTCLAGYLLGALGTMSVARMALAFAREDGLTSAPLMLAGAYLTGFAVLHVATASVDEGRLARARVSSRS